MRPMKLAGEQLIFGKDGLDHIATLPYKRVTIVTGGSSMKKSGMLDNVKERFEKNGAEIQIIDNVEPDPSINTVIMGRDKMLEFNPDLIVALGGGSAMDAAKAMWIYYEHPELNKIQDLLPPNEFPKLHKKSHMCCIPSTSGTASEVSRSIVITENSTGQKFGIGNMEMMPDIAICDPIVTASMPKHITAETGMDALTHALEALVSNRANYVSNLLAEEAAIQIINNIEAACNNGSDMEIREKMLNASMIAGMAFTNVSLGIVHSMAHTLGSIFHVSHGLADAILLPYIIKYNDQNEEAKAIYEGIAKKLNGNDLAEIIKELNKKIGIPSSLKELGISKEEYLKELDVMAEMAKNDGCTKTNPIIPPIDEFKKLFIKVYEGE